MPKALNTDTNVRYDEMRAALAVQVGEMWDKHLEGFTAILDEAEIKKVKLSFGATLDFTDSEPALETTMSYSQVVKDKRVTTFSDPNQIGLPLGGSGATGPLAEQPDEGPVTAHKRRKSTREEGAEAGD